jgi:hypothetical protein
VDHCEILLDNYTRRIMSMKHDLSIIRDKDVPNLISKLTTFLRKETVEACLLKYEQSLRSSGPLYRDNYLKLRHPWWDTWVAYKDLRRSGKVTYRNLTGSMLKLASDAKMICILAQHMPTSVRDKYRHDLVGEGAQPISLNLMLLGTIT